MGEFPDEFTAEAFLGWLEKRSGKKITMTRVEETGIPENLDAPKDADTESEDGRA